jgi:hypothetical protein
MRFPRPKPVSCWGTSERACMSWNGATCRPSSKRSVQLYVPKPKARHQLPPEVQQFWHEQLRDIRDQAQLYRS